MRLSEAIRKGCLEVPEQAFREYFNNDGSASCALGAAVVGVMGKQGAFEYDAKNDLMDILDKQFPLLKVKIHPKCPVDFCRHKSPGSPVLGQLYIPEGESQSDVYDLVNHLNDAHEWERERIADYVERHFEAVMVTTQEAKA